MILLKLFCHVETVLCQIFVINLFYKNHVSDMYPAITCWARKHALQYDIFFFYILYQTNVDIFHFMQQ